jgi:hypothetical protein
VLAVQRARGATSWWPVVAKSAASMLQQNPFSTELIQIVNGLVRLCRASMRTKLTLTLGARLLASLLRAARRCCGRFVKTIQCASPPLPGSGVGAEPHYELMVEVEWSSSGEVELLERRRNLSDVVEQKRCSSSGVSAAEVLESLVRVGLPTKPHSNAVVVAGLAKLGVQPAAISAERRTELETAPVPSSLEHVRTDTLLRGYLLSCMS